ncbi:hypothetical protein Glove_352g40 [Diversispora epigaea]|uniref:Uncharacterized protein n=1 Tax=Diversispora epigaea TaxID=1348612 RepID=A0A397HBS5_9GLOM|nr:hypothetical protein Glove_352g40 [Diversispora epigaea]
MKTITMPNISREIAQNSTLLGDLKEWTNENFKTLKHIFRQCLPLIRYFHIYGTDVWSKNNFSSRIAYTTLSTTIITYEHASENSSWIDRKSSTYSLTINFKRKYKWICTSNTALVTKVKICDSAIWNANKTSQVIYCPWLEIDSVYLV